MKDNIFIKKLSDFDRSADSKTNELFGAATRNAPEFVTRWKIGSAKTGLRVMKMIAAGVTSLLLLFGFTGCMTDTGDFPETQSQETLDTEETDEITTNRDPEETTDPEDTTGPEETTDPGGTTDPEDTTGPEGTTGPEETTGPEDPPAVEDMPGDADGYAYPKYFADKLGEMIFLNGAIGGPEGVLANVTPEILFVERGDAANATTQGGVIIYAKYDIGENNPPIYTRFAFTINSRDLANLNKSSKYSSYEEYIDAVITAMESKAVLLSAETSEINNKQDSINATIGENFAKFVDPNFVDVEINFVRDYTPPQGDSYHIISGFGYDKDGKSYSFNLELDLRSTTEYNTIYDVIKLLNDGKTPQMDRVTTKKAVINSVFIPESQSEQ